PAQGLLLGGERVPPLTLRVGPAYLLQLRRLHAVGDADMAHRPRLTPFLQRGVVQVAMVSQKLHRAALLRPRWVGAELVGSSQRHPVRVAGVVGPGRCRLAGLCRKIVGSDTDIFRASTLRGGSAPSRPA